MKTIHLAYLLLLSGIFFGGCDTDSIDQERPIIDFTLEGSFPQACDTIYFDEAFELRAFFSDNESLASFSLDVHHNFDHHSHSTEPVNCDLDSTKEAINPFVFIQDYLLSSAEIEVSEQILFSSDSSQLHDSGDYHFFLRLTDINGWTSYRGVPVKLLYRDSGLN